MDVTLYIILSLILPIFVLLAIIVIKMLAGNALPDSNYTPIDQMFGQTSIDVHEQKVEQIEGNEQGDGKDKNIKKL